MSKASLRRTSDGFALPMLLISIELCHYSGFHADRLGSTGKVMSGRSFFVSYIDPDILGCWWDESIVITNGAIACHEETMFHSASRFDLSADLLYRPPCQLEARSRGRSLARMGRRWVLEIAALLIPCHNSTGSRRNQLPFRPCRPMRCSRCFSRALNEQACGVMGQSMAAHRGRLW